MTTNTKRHYSIKDVEMIIAAATIIESAIKHKDFLQSKRSTWADPFFDNIGERIDNASQVHLGVDNAKELRQASQVVYSIQKTALDELGDIKVQISQDFKKDPQRKAEILTQLGFTSYYATALKMDQEALIDLLYQFKNNLTSELKSEIVAKGTAGDLLDTVAGYAGTLKNANITQEGFKGTRKEITAAAIAEFNEIYDAVISITKISQRFFRDNPAAKQQFSFEKVAKTMNAG